MILRPFTSLVLAICVASVACAGESGSPLVVRSDSAGVSIVTSAGSDRPLDWRDEEVLRLGGKEEGPESFYLLTRSTVGHDDAGRIYVLDLRANRVVVFGPDGTHVRTMGGPGEGPGEISRPGTMAVSPDGSVSVFDYGRGGLARFGPEGEVLASSAFPFYPWPGQGRHIGATPDGLLVAALVTPDVEGTFQHALQRIAGSDTTRLAQRSFPQPSMVRYPSCGGGLNLPAIFEVQLTWAVESSRIAVSRSAEYDVEIIDDGGQTRRVRRDLSTRAATNALAEKELGEGFRIDFGSGPCVIAPAEMVEKRGVADFVPWINDVAVSPTGELWVQRKMVGSTAEGPTDVFDATGAYIGTRSPEASFPLFFLSANRFAAFFKDDFDVYSLVVYDIDRGSS